MGVFDFLRRKKQDFDSETGREAAKKRWAKEQTEDVNQYVKAIEAINKAEMAILERRAAQAKYDAEERQRLKEELLDEWEQYSDADAAPEPSPIENVAMQLLHDYLKAKMSIPAGSVKAGGDTAAAAPTAAVDIPALVSLLPASVKKGIKKGKISKEQAVALAATQGIGADTAAQVYEYVQKEVAEP